MSNIPFLAEEGNVIEGLHFYSYLGWGGGQDGNISVLPPPPQQTHEHVYSNTHVHHTQKKESHRFTNTTQIKYTHTQVHNHIWTHYTNHLHKLYMNTDTTYRTRCQQVQGAVNRFTGENYVSTEAVIWFTGKNQIKVGFKLICRILRKLTIKNLPTKIAVMTLKS